MLLPVFQKIGQSSHLLAQEVGSLQQTKATHTGTLDPAASGVLVVLTDEDRFKKSEYSKWTKEYICEVLVGVSTDTHDMLGLISDVKENLPVIKLPLEQVIGTYKQVLPSFSAKRIDGKSSFDYAKKEVEIAKHSASITIFSITKSGSWTIKSEALQKGVVKLSELVFGDFRQSEIKTNWMEKLPKSNWQVISLVITCSHKTYIRGVVRDLSKALKVPLTVLSLTRTRNGPYSLTECKTPNKL